MLPCLEGWVYRSQLALVVAVAGVRFSGEQRALKVREILLGDADRFDVVVH